MSRSDVLLKSITEFYDDQSHFDLLKNILEKKSGVSLRNLELFITDYSKKRNLAYTTKSGKLFSVHMCDERRPHVLHRVITTSVFRRRSYKSSLDVYSKKLFDPFCRTDKIDFKGLQTTVAQLNFIRWCAVIMSSTRSFKRLCRARTFSSLLTCELDFEGASRTTSSRRRKRRWWTQTPA